MLNALAMAAGLQLTHCLVPPTPGPTTAASMLGADVGQMIICGSLVSISMLIVAVFYCRMIGKKIYQVPTDDGGFERKEFKQEYIKSMEELDRMIGQKQLPSLGVSIAPIIVPLVNAYRTRIRYGCVYDSRVPVGVPDRRDRNASVSQRWRQKTVRRAFPYSSRCS